MRGMRHDWFSHLLIIFTYSSTSTKLLQRIAPGDYLQRKEHSQEILSLLKGVNIDEKDQVYYELFKSMVRTYSTTPLYLTYLLTQ